MFCDKGQNWQVLNFPCGRIIYVRYCITRKAFRVISHASVLILKPTFAVVGLPLFLSVCSPGGDPPSPMLPTLIAKTVVTFFPWHETPQRESDEPTSGPTKGATAPKRPPEDTSFIRSEQLRKNENSTITWLRHGSDSRMPRERRSETQEDEKENEKMKRGKKKHGGHRYVPSSFLSELSTQTHTVTSPRKGKQNQPSSVWNPTHN